MQLKEFNNNELSELCELYLSERNTRDSDYYIDRLNNFWGPYEWFQPANKKIWGVVEGKKVVAMAALVKLPFHFATTKEPIYLSTDFFVHANFRKSMAASKLVRYQQMNIPDDKCYEIGIENQPGFLDPLIKISEKHNNKSRWLKNSILTQYFVVAKSEDDIGFFVSEKIEDLSKYWKFYKEQVKKNDSIQFIKDLNILNFKNIKYFSIEDKENKFCGFFCDKTSMQKIRWNGRPRVEIERHRLKLKKYSNSDFVVDDELTFLNVCFPYCNTKDEVFLKKVQERINTFAFENNYFCWTIRDWGFPECKSSNYSVANYERRILLNDNIDLMADFNLVEQLNKDRNLIESVFL
jgi:hypothetical protein